MKTHNIAASCLTVALGLLGAGTATAATTDAPALSHEAEPGDSTSASVTVTSSDALAGESLTVLIMNDDADATDPSTEDVVFIEQYELDDAGATDFQIQLPTEVLEDYDIALNTAAATDRYLAPLAGAGDPDDDSTQEPDDGATSEPDDGATSEPEEEPSTDPDDNATAAPDDDATTDPADGQDGTENASDGSGSGAADGNDDGSQAGDSAGKTDDGAGEDQSSDGFLASTGASITVGVLIALAAIGLGTLLVLRRRKAS